MNKEEGSGTVAFLVTGAFILLLTKKIIIEGRDILYQTGLYFISVSGSLTRGAIYLNG